MCHVVYCYECDNEFVLDNWQTVIGYRNLCPNCNSYNYGPPPEKDD